MAESKIQRKIIRELRKINDTVTTKPLVTNRVGEPDLKHFNTGICFPIEVKDVGEEPREAQLYNIKIYRRAGFPAFYTDNWEHTKRCIAKVLKAELLRVQNGGTLPVFNDEFFK